VRQHREQSQPIIVTIALMKGISMRFKRTWGAGYAEGHTCYNAQTGMCQVETGSVNRKNGDKEEEKKSE